MKAHRFMRVVAALALFSTVAALSFPRVWGPSIGRYLAVPDRPGKADAIVVLSGSLFVRIDKAVELYKQGWAPRVVAFVPSRTNDYDAIRDLLDGDVPYKEMIRRYLIAAGVPASAILIDDTRTVDSTQDERDNIRDLATRERLSSLLLVSSPYHMRRSLTLLERIHPGRPLDVFHVAANDPLQHPGQWWHDSSERQAVLVEYLSLLYTLAADR